MTKVTAEPFGSERYQLAEGPVWLAERHRVVAVNILEGAIVELDLAHGSTVQRARLNEPVGAVAPAAGGLIAATGRRILRLCDAGDNADLTAPLTSDLDQRLNDGKADPFGNFCVGTTSLSGASGRSALYLLRPDGSVRTVMMGLSVSNGLAWTPDGGTMFHIDTPRRAITRWDYSPDGPVGDEPVGTIDLSDLPGYPDGMCIDDDGNLWVALWGGSAVICVTPAGRQVARIGLPASQPTCPAFAGEDGGTLVVTSATHGLKRPSTEDGAVFLARPGVTGPPPHPYRIEGAPK